MDNVELLRLEALKLPEEVSLRWAFVDALEERGKPHDLLHAELIRIQMLPEPERKEREAEECRLQRRLVNRLVRLPKRCRWRAVSVGPGRFELEWDDLLTGIEVAVEGGLAKCVSGEVGILRACAEVLTKKVWFSELKLDRMPVLYMPDQRAFQFGTNNGILGEDEWVRLDDVKRLRDQYDYAGDDIDLVVSASYPGYRISEEFEGLWSYLINHLKPGLTLHNIVMPTFRSLEQFQSASGPNGSVFISTTRTGGCSYHNVPPLQVLTPPPGSGHYQGVLGFMSGPLT